MAKTKKSEAKRPVAILSVFGLPGMTSDEIQGVASWLDRQATSLRMNRSKDYSSRFRARFMLR